MYSWEDLAARALARQFPDVPGREVDSVARALHLIGPIQAQTARSLFLALAARMPGVTLETVSAAYDGHRIVRGSNIRGTVRTASTPEDNALLRRMATAGSASTAPWRRTLKLQATALEDIWSGIEDFARDTWRTPAEPATTSGSRSTTQRPARPQPGALRAPRPRQDRAAQRAAQPGGQPSPGHTLAFIGGSEVAHRQIGASGSRRNDALLGRTPSWSLLSFRVLGISRTPEWELHVTT